MGFIDFLITIGPIVDESLDNNFIHTRPCAKARQILLLMWLFVGLFLFQSYKSVLLANIINVDYEKTIDTIDDVLESGMPLCIPSQGVTDLMNTDPRESVKKLITVMKPFEYNGTSPHWVSEG